MQSTIVVNKSELIEKIKENMETHQSTYDTAVEEFRKQQIKLLEDQLEAARTGKQFDRLAMSRLPVPENHIGDYHRALKMLEMDTQDVVELNEYDFNQLVMDEWEWRRSFLANTTSYVIGAGE